MFVSRISSGDEVLTAGLDFCSRRRGAVRRCSAPGPDDTGSQVSTRTHTCWDRRLNKMAVGPPSPAQSTETSG